MNLKKLLAVCVYGACFLGGLFVLLDNVALFQSFSLFGAGWQGVVVGAISLVALLLIFATMLVPVIGCIMMFANKTDPAKVGGATTELGKSLFFLLWILALVMNIMLYLITDPQSALAFIQYVFSYMLFWIPLIMAVAGSILMMIGKNKAAEYNVTKAVLYMVGAGLLVVAFFVGSFSTAALSIVAQILIGGALICHAVKTSLLK